MDTRDLSDVEWATIRTYAPIVSGVAKGLSVPLWWDVPEFGAGGRRTGTVCLVNTGEALLGITAAHVHEEIARRLDRRTSTLCQLGAHTFDPRVNIIESDSALDLATYRLTEIELASVSNMTVGVPSIHIAHQARVWPPSPLRQADVCIVGGYPWALTRDPNPNQREFDFLSFIVRLDEDEGAWVLTRIDPDTSKAYTERSLPKGTNIGGLSGGPVMRYTEPRGGLATFELCAITSDYANSSIVRGTLSRPLSYVLADGRLKR